MEVLNESGWYVVDPEPPMALFSHCMVTVTHTTLAVIGGNEDDIYSVSKKSYFYNVESKEWTKGPDLQIGRADHSCGMVRQSNGSDSFSIIVAGGSGTDAGRSVEILDAGSASWRFGSDLMSDTQLAIMVEEWTGSVLLVGGDSKRSIYRLDHAGEGHSWIQLPQKLAKSRTGFTAFLIPDHFVNCTPNLS